MNILLRFFKAICTKKQTDNYEKARLARINKQLRQQSKGRRAEDEIQGYLTRLTPDELEVLINTKKDKQS